MTQSRHKAPPSIRKASDPMPWPLHSWHKDYGEVVMRGSLLGEAYRWFDDHKGGIAMMPLDTLNPDDMLLSPARLKQPKIRWPDSAINKAFDWGW